MFTPPSPRQPKSTGKALINGLPIYWIKRLTHSRLFGIPNLIVFLVLILLIIVVVVLVIISINFLVAANLSCRYGEKGDKSQHHRQQAEQ